MTGPGDAGEGVRQGWYGVRCVFQCGAEAPYVYEERITVRRAAGFVRTSASRRSTTCSTSGGMVPRSTR